MFDVEYGMWDLPLGSPIGCIVGLKMGLQVALLNSARRMIG